MKPLLFIGGGGHCKSVIEAAESQGRKILGVLDVPSEQNKTVLGKYKILGVDDDIPFYVSKVEFMITVGFIKDVHLRILLYNKVQQAGGVLANVIASTAHVSAHANLSGGGISILHNAMINAAAHLGSNVIINTSAVVEHDAVLGSHTHLSTGAIVNGDAHIGQRCFIGSQSVVANSITICDDVIIGAGSVVIKNITKPGVYVGCPVERIGPP